MNRDANIRGRSVASRENMDGTDLCGRYLVCLKHSEEAPVVGVERVRRDEEREVMAMTGMSSQVGFPLF